MKIVKLASLSLYMLFCTNVFGLPLDCPHFNETYFTDGKATLSVSFVINSHTHACIEPRGIIAPLNPFTGGKADDVHFSFTNDSGGDVFMSLKGSMAGLNVTGAGPQNANGSYTLGNGNAFSITVDGGGIPDLIPEKFSINNGTSMSSLCWVFSDAGQVGDCDNPVQQPVFRVAQARAEEVGILFFAVPEPGTYILMGLGLFLIWGVRERKHNLN